MEYSTYKASCYVTGENRKPIVIFGQIKDDADAWAYYDDELFKDGWGKMRIYTNSKSKSMDQMLCAGYVDYYLAHERINHSFYYFKVGNQAEQGWPASWVEWMQKNIDYVQHMIQTNPEDQYWIRMNLIVEQVRGMVQGYNDRRSELGDTINLLDAWILQSAGDFDDLESILPDRTARDPELTLKCTGLIKMAPNYEDVYFAQDTWSSYTELEAYLKEYHFNVPEFKAKHVSLSTRTGHLGSVDDFWATDRGLVILETTMHNFNSTLYTFVKPQSILTWMRSYYAAWVADSGKEWTTEFIKENSGTYNNEYIVLDSKKFQRGVKPTSDLLWMIEQYPTVYHSEDITERFVKQNWWPSVNAPYFQDMFDIANYSGQQKKEPWKADFWSYFNQPRYKLLERDAPKIQNYEQFKSLMRYNDWKHDSIIQGEPAQGVLSRYDLRPINGTRFGARNSFGGLDSKTCKLSEVYGNLMFDAINSPNYEQNPPFNFSDWPSIKVIGLPTVWKFPWISFKSNDFDRCTSANDNATKCLEMEFCGYCLISSVCMPGNGKQGPNRGYNCTDGWQFRISEPAYARPLVIIVSLIIVVFVSAIYITAFCSRKESEPKYDTIQ